MTLYDYLSQPACSGITRILVPRDWANVRVPATVLAVEPADIDGYVEIYAGPAPAWKVGTSGLTWEAGS